MIIAVGLYSVVWGKAKDYVASSTEEPQKPPNAPEIATHDLKIDIANGDMEQLEVEISKLGAQDPNSKL